MIGYTFFSSCASYWYNFDTNYWNAVYKQTYGKDFKFKAGYDSAVRVGWASLWVSGSRINFVKTEYSYKNYNQLLDCEVFSSQVSFCFHLCWFRSGMKLGKQRQRR